MKRFPLPFPRFRPGIRLQLLCGYTAVFTLVLLLAGALSYHYFENALEENVTTSLQIEAHQIAEEILVGNDTLTIHDVTGKWSGILSGPEPVKRAWFVPRVLMVG